MKFKPKSNNLDVTDAVEAVLVQTIEIDCTTENDDVKENKEEETSKDTKVLMDLFELLQQKIRTYNCFQLYFHKKASYNAVDYFRHLEHETKRSMENLLLVFDGNKIPALPEISFDFEDDKEAFMISEKLEEDTAKLLQKIYENSKDDFIKVQWLTEFKIVKTLATVKRLAKENKNGFCDKSLNLYSGPCCASC